MHPALFSAALLAGWAGHAPLGRSKIIQYPLASPWAMLESLTWLFPTNTTWNSDTRCHLRVARVAMVYLSRHMRMKLFLRSVQEDGTLDGQAHSLIRSDVGSGRSFCAPDHHSPAGPALSEAGLSLAGQFFLRLALVISTLTVRQQMYCLSHWQRFVSD